MREWERVKLEVRHWHQVARCLEMIEHAQCDGDVELALEDLDVLVGVDFNLEKLRHELRGRLVPDSWYDEDPRPSTLTGD